MITHLLIGTTAINRRDLHSEVIPAWLTLLKKVSDVKIIWFVNIDVIDLLEYTYDETKANFMSLIPFETVYLPQKEAGFLNSCFLLSKAINNYVIDNKIVKNDACVLWLEDDWKLKEENIIPVDYLLKIVNNLSYVNLSLLRKNYFWALAPSIISFSLFEKLHFKCWGNAVNSANIGDPENLLGLYFLNNFNLKPENSKTLNISSNNFSGLKAEYLKYKYAKNLNFSNNIQEIKSFIKDDINFIRILPQFIDYGAATYGRNYMEAKGIQKWDKGDSSCKYSVIPDRVNNDDDLLATISCRISDKMNIIYLVDEKIFRTKMSRVRFHSIRALEKIANVIYWGPGWEKYNINLSIDENIKKQNLIVDFIIYYKGSENAKIGESKILKCITYNEMWDEDFTLNEINFTKPDLIICHHKNDLNHYTQTLFKKISCYTQLVYIPHCAEKTIFRDLQLQKDIDVLLCGAMAPRTPLTLKNRTWIFFSFLKELLVILYSIIRSIFLKHKTFNFNKLKNKFHLSIFGYHEKYYPLRQKFRSVLKLMPDNYNCLELEHPGYNKGDAFTDIYQQNFAELINRSKICITCTSRFKYRLGKLVEIPMSGSVLACDIPNQDKLSFSKNTIVIDENMSSKEIANKLIFYLENETELEKIKKNGSEWSQKYNQEYYANKLVENLQKVNRKELKLFVLAEDFTTINTKWICDTFKDEFIKYAKINFVENPNDAHIIWLLAPWRVSKISKDILINKFVITTLHHIDFTKYKNNKDYYKLIDSITNRYHAICDVSYNDIRKITKKEIIKANFWINEHNFYEIKAKSELKLKYIISEGPIVIGSFQKDTEGKGNNKPKLTKGPDIFIDIVKDLKKSNRDILVVLTGWRRSYIIKQLEKFKIKYVYFELVETKQLNELYNCLDLYIVSSRVEGGPRAIMECALTKTPIISTRVGVSELILSPESIYDMDNFISYKKAIPNVEYAYNNAQNYLISNYIKKFACKVFYEIR